MNLRYTLCYVLGSLSIGYALSGCTVKAVGDPDRPITINAHVTLDIKGLENTATDIEEYVSGEDPQLDAPTTQGGSHES
mgnify:CR=1 FL=1